MKNKGERPPYFLPVFIVGGVSISFASILIKFCPEVPALIIASYRTGLVSIALLPFFLLRRAKTPRRLIYLTLVSGTALAFHFAFWIGSLKFTTVASSLFVLSIYPFITALLSLILLGERVPSNFIIGSGLAVAGIGIIFSADIHSLKFTTGNVLSLLGALALAVYFVSGRRARRDMDLLEYLFLVYCWASVLLIFTSLVYGLAFTGYHAKTYAYLFLLAAVSQGLGHSSFNWALRYVKTGLVSLTTLVEPIGASLLAWLFLKENPGSMKLAGMGLVALGIFLGWLRE